MDVTDEFSQMIEVEGHLIDSKILTKILDVIIDLNGLQAFGRTTDISGDVSLIDKWRAFGWSVCEASGHDPVALSAILKCVPFTPGRPSVLVAHTVKGAGVSFMEDRLAWHYRSPDVEQFSRAMDEVTGR